MIPSTNQSSGIRVISAQSIPTVWNKIYSKTDVSIELRRLQEITGELLTATACLSLTSLGFHLNSNPPTVLRLQLDRPPPVDKPSYRSFSWLSSVLLCHLNLSVLRLFREEIQPRLDQTSNINKDLIEDQKAFRNILLRLLKTSDIGKDQIEVKSK